MYKTEMQKIGVSSEKKIAFMRQSPFSYTILSALAGIYLGFGIVLIFSVAGPIAADGGGAYLKLIMGPSFGIALSLVIALIRKESTLTNNNAIFHRNPFTLFMSVRTTFMTVTFILIKVCNILVLL